MAGTPVSELLASGATLKDLLTAGVTIENLLNGGAPLNDLLAAGATTDQFIGVEYQGGKIAYFLQSGDPGYDENVTHGIIAAPSDQSTGIQWYNGKYTATGATPTALGTGNANTNIIVTNQGEGSYASKLYADLVLGGYSDWYLPSKDELNKLYLNRVAVGGFDSSYAWIFYWSSSDYSMGTMSAKAQTFNDGYQKDHYKFGEYMVRAIRSF